MPKFEKLRYTIGQNPRAVKQLINQVSLLNILKLHIWDYIYKNTDLKDLNFPGFAISDSIMETDKFPTFLKEMTVVLQCIKTIYPDLFLALLIDPYFKGWTLKFSEQFNNLAINKSYVQSIIEQKPLMWECALFKICQFNELSKHKFYNIKIVLNFVDKMIAKLYSEHKQDGVAISPEQEKMNYMTVFKLVFVLFYRMLSRS